MTQLAKTMEAFEKDMPYNNIKAHQNEVGRSGTFKRAGSIIEEQFEEKSLLRKPHSESNDVKMSDALPSENSSPSLNYGYGNATQINHIYQENSIKYDQLNST
jgi:hypothetical protein